jgi:hypothetical protein
MMHSLQKMCPHCVTVGDSTRSRQIGQSRESELLIFERTSSMKLDSFSMD